MSEPFLSEIRLMSFGFPPKGWALCDGQLLPINQNQALFSLLGTTYGGDGRVNFALPNLQGRVPLHMGNGYTLGELTGEEDHTLNITEIPVHTHPANCTNAGGTLYSPKGAIWAADPNGNIPYSAGDGSSMSSRAIAPTGGSQPHENRSPFLVLSFCIALQGIFPSQN